MADRSSSDGLSERLGVLTRREVEARIVGPLIDGLAEEFGRARVIGVVAEIIARIARQEGADLASDLGDDVDAFVASLDYWRRDGALEIDLIEQTPERLAFNVTRCRYAELYRSLGLQHLGAVLSCNRDGAFIEGFNPQASLDRPHTIMEGGSCCKFRYRFPGPHEGGRKE